MPFGKWLIASQVALSVVLLVAAGLLMRSMRLVEQTDTGFDRRQLIVADISPDAREYGGARWLPLANELLKRLRAVPGVSAATVSVNGLFTGTEGDEHVRVDGFTAKSAADSLVLYDQVGADYFRTIGARLIAGRDLTSSDGAPAPRVAVINETMARFYFGRPDRAIGRSILVGPTGELPIVGVVADVKDHGLVSTPTRRFYTSYFNPADSLDFMRLEIRVSGDPSSLVHPIHDALAASGSSVHISSVRPLAAVIESTLNQDRLLARLALAFGAAALGLAALGLYGVMNYTIARRGSEFGLRLTLGATRWDLARLIFGEAFAQVVVGIVTGIPIAVIAARALRSQLHGFDGADPMTIVVTATVLLVSAVGATMGPAFRATRVAPMEALRND
jgi:predicted permease